MVGPAVIGQTITVVNRSGKVVSTSRHLLDVFKEAKSAYRERKAEIVASRHATAGIKAARRSSKVHTIEDDRSSIPTTRTSPQYPRSPQTGVPHRKPVADRRHSGSSAGSRRSSVYPESRHKFEQDLDLPSPRSPRSPRSMRSHGQELTRRHTALDSPTDRVRPRTLTRSMSASAIDMDLAYGELPPDLVVAKAGGEEVELKGLVTKVKQLLDEADCVQYSVTAIVAKLQKNPEAMAAVALTLAEISNIVSKMAPGMVMGLKGAAPAVFALLVSPQFLIAAGVGVGVTIVAFGGYKIIKKIRAKHTAEESSMDEMLEYGGDVSRIDNWRRGIAEVEGHSVGTSVEGEFITPRAASLSKLNLREEKIRDSQREASGVKSSRGSKTSKRDKEDRSSKTSTSSKPEKEKKQRKEKKPSPLRLMFKS